MKGNKEDENCRNLLFDGQVELWLPDDFHENSELVEKRYPFKNRPSVINVDPAGEAFITFDLFSKPLSARQVTAAAAGIRKTILQVYPYNDGRTLKRFRTNQGLRGAGFSFYTWRKCGRQFTELFVLPIHGRLFIGTESCPEESLGEWDGVFRKVRRGVREV